MGIFLQYDTHTLYCDDGIGNYDFLCEYTVIDSVGDYAVSS